MRHFEQVVLMSEDGTKTIVERRYSTGEIEYWGMMTVQVKSTLGQGSATVPFKIEIPGVICVPDEMMEHADRLALVRDAAFANFQAAFDAHKEGAANQIKHQVNQAARREQSKIILAGAVGCK